MFKKYIHYSPDLETSILGACLLEPAAFARIFGIVTPEVFYSTGHSQIFSFLVEMFENNIPIDLISTHDFITRKKAIAEFSNTNTAYFLTKLTNTVVSTANIEYYAYVLKQMWVDREIITLTSAGIKSENSRQEITNLQNKLTELSSNEYSIDWMDMTALMVNLYKHQDEMMKTKGMGLQTGIATIDRLYGGFYGGQMIVLGARPSIGKSAFAGQIALNMALRGNSVGFISMEMKNNEIAARMASIDTEMNFNEIYRGLYTDENQRQSFYNRVNNSTSILPIYVSDTTDLNVTEIKAKAYKLKHKKGLKCLIIDYLQLVDGEGHANRNRENEVAKISRGFKIIAKELDVPLIVLCQLNREVEKRKGNERFPQLSDFRESGAIEQDADVAMFLHSDYKSGRTEDENGFSTEGRAHLVIRKWRNGISNIIIDLDFDGPKMSFKEKKNLYPVRDTQGDNPF